MGAIIAFLIGMIIGGVFGCVLTALVVADRTDDDERR